jgi:hypothetical protein
MPRFGTIKRLYPKVEVLRGFNPNEPHQFSRAIPVAIDTTGSQQSNANYGKNILIYSGQVISQSWNSVLGAYEWVLGWTAGIPYIALQDSFQEDVLEAGNLVGLSCAGQFEIETAFWSDGSGGLQTGGGAAFVVDAILSPDGTSGYIQVGTIGSGDPIIGYVTRNHGPRFLGPTGSGNNGTNSSAVVANEYVVSFQTAYAPNPA